MKRLILFVLLFFGIHPAYCHSSWKEHAPEMLGVFGFDPNGLRYNELEQKWAKYISSDMIDKWRPYYKELQNKHPGFTCRHRALFHWGYNAEPWNEEIEKKVLEYCRKTNCPESSYSDTIALFRQELKEEQKRRNGLMNKRTEELFGFASGGRDAQYANRMVSLAYNIHILGDYMSDNQDLSGLLDIRKLIEAIIDDVRTLDKVESKQLIRGINSINNKYSNPQEKADRLMAYLLEEVPPFFKKVSEGALARRLEKQGYLLKRA